MVSREEMERALAERHGKELYEKFSSAAVAVCGLGGLGSNIAVSLIRAGVGRLILFDFDRVDITNLHRQQYRADQVGRFKTEALCESLREINPYCRLEAHTVRITEENAPKLLADATSCAKPLTEPNKKAMLADAVMSMMPDTYLVSASGMAGLGSANEIRTRRITERFYICGDGSSDAEEGIGLVASRVAVCAGHQAHMVLRTAGGKA